MVKKKKKGSQDGQGAPKGTLLFKIHNRCTVCQGCVHRALIHPVGYSDRDHGRVAFLRTENKDPNHQQ